MPTTFKWVIVVAIECALGWFAYSHAFIIKWPPQGPVKYFLGWGTWGVLFLAASAVFWSVVALFRLFWMSRSENNNISILKP